tara:strand:+ start:290 stop:913 length:624 start_codon:yes stop_codon:yes gene_type:complete
MDIYKDVIKFQKEIIKAIPYNKIPDKKEMEFIQGTLDEEIDELVSAYHNKDYGEMGDALIDLIYFALGHAYRMGIPFETMWKEVHEANMNKKVAKTVRGEKDAEKPADWVAPNHNWIENMSDLFKDATQVQMKKDKDYNQQSNLDDYFPFGEVSYIQMIYIKALRMVNIAKSEKIHNESMQDSLIDLVNYASFMYKKLKSISYIEKK